MITLDLSAAALDSLDINALEIKESFQILGEVDNPLPEFFERSVEGPDKRGDVHTTLTPRIGVQVWMLPYEPTDTQGYSNEAVGVISAPECTVKIYVVYSLEQGESVSIRSRYDS